MSQIFANSFRGDLLLFEVAIILVGTLGPALVRARGARLLWLGTGGIWLAVALAIRFLQPADSGMLGFVAVCLGLAAALAVLLGKFNWPVAVQSLVGFLIAIALLPVSVYTLLFLAEKFGPGAP